MRKYLFILLIAVMIPSFALAGDEFRFFGELALRGASFTDSNPDQDSYRGEVKFSPRMELRSSSVELVFSADFRGGYPDEMYEQAFSVYRSDGEKPAGLLQEFYLECGSEKSKIRLGRFKPEDTIKFDFFRLSPFASIDSSEPFLSLDKDRLLGNWGGLLSYNFGLVKAELIAFAHEDPILATDPDDRWTRPLPLGFSFGEFKSDKDVDWGARLSGRIASAQWEATFFNGSSQNANSIEADLEKGECNLIFPEQTTVQAAIQLPLGPFNLRAGASQNWREWNDEEAEFVSYISELEYIRENVFRGGDNLFLEIGYADVQDEGSPSELFVDNLGIDQIYRGGSVLATVEYSPSESWVIKARGIYNTEHKSSYVCPEVRKMFYTDFGEADVYLLGMIISGESDDVISAYRDCDNVEIGIKLFF